MKKIILALFVVCLFAGMSVADPKVKVNTIVLNALTDLCPNSTTYTLVKTSYSVSVIASRTYRKQITLINQSTMTMQVMVGSTFGTTPTPAQLQTAGIKLLPKNWQLTQAIVNSSTTIMIQNYADYKFTTSCTSKIYVTLSDDEVAGVAHTGELAVFEEWW